jgi:WD40 repeat protein
MIVSPDGTMLAAYKDSESFSLWDLTGGRPIGSIKVPPDARFVSGGFSPDNRALALDGNDGTIRLYEVATASLRTTRVIGPPKKGNEPPAIGAAPPAVTVPPMAS